MLSVRAAFRFNPSFVALFKHVNANIKVFFEVTWHIKTLQHIIVLSNSSGSMLHCIIVPSHWLQTTWSHAVSEEASHSWWPAGMCVLHPCSHGLTCIQDLMETLSTCIRIHCTQLYGEREKEKEIPSLSPQLNSAQLSLSLLHLLHPTLCNQNVSHPFNKKTSNGSHSSSDSDCRRISWQIQG